MIRTQLSANKGCLYLFYIYYIFKCSTYMRHLNAYAMHTMCIPPTLCMQQAIILCSKHGEAAEYTMLNSVYSSRQWGV